MKVGYSGCLLRFWAAGQSMTTTTTTMTTTMITSRMTTSVLEAVLLLWDIINSSFKEFSKFKSNKAAGWLSICQPRVYVKYRIRAKITNGWGKMVVEYDGGAWWHSREPLHQCNIKVLEHRIPCRLGRKWLQTLEVLQGTSGPRHSKTHSGPEKRKTQKKYPSDHSLSHKRGSERSGQASKWLSAAERASKASIAEWTNEWTVWANEWMDKRVAQYLHLDLMIILAHSGTWNIHASCAEITSGGRYWYMVAAYGGAPDNIRTDPKWAF